MQFYFRNVNAAFVGLVRAIDKGHLPMTRQPSRYGEVLQVEEPVTVTYSNPRERVLMNEARDANPFFHLYESLWMLAGRNDVAPLAYYNSRMSEFSDDGKVFRGAYGHRWRHASILGDALFNRPSELGMALAVGDLTGVAEVDQLDVIVKHLQAQPHSRRAVLQMWNVADDLCAIDEHVHACQVCGGSKGWAEGGTWGDCARCHGKGVVVTPASRDVCCNVVTTFQMRDKPGNWHPETGVNPNTAPAVPAQRVLDLTVFNRSNDMVWGMLGANAVQFSVLQEYVAARLGVGVGRYNQITANMHVYTNTWKPKEWLEAENAHHGMSPEQDPIPLVANPEAFERQLPEFVEQFSGSFDLNEHVWSEPFLGRVAAPMLRAFALYRASRRLDTSDRVSHMKRALQEAETVVDSLWKQAAVGWLERRAIRANQQFSVKVG